MDGTGVKSYLLLPGHMSDHLASPDLIMFHIPQANAQACEDYRASATIDLEHDRADLESGNKIQIPHLKVIWGGKGMIDSLNKGNVEGIWRGYCGDRVELTMERFDCGHYIAEEKPGELLGVLEGYL